MLPASTQSLQRCMVVCRDARIALFGADTMVKEVALGDIEGLLEHAEDTYLFILLLSSNAVLDVQDEQCQQERQQLQKMVAEIAQLAHVGVVSVAPEIAARHGIDDLDLEPLLAGGYAAQAHKSDICIYTHCRRLCASHLHLHLHYMFSWYACAGIQIHFVQCRCTYLLKMKPFGEDQDFDDLLNLEPRWPVKALQTAVCESVPDFAVQLAASNIQAFMGGQSGVRASTPKARPLAPSPPASCVHVTLSRGTWPLRHAPSGHEARMCACTSGSMHVNDELLSCQLVQHMLHAPC